MARTLLALNTLIPNNGIAAPVAATIDQALGMNVQFPTTGVPAAPVMDNLILVVNNTAVSSKTVTVRAGVGGGTTPGPAWRSGIGDLNVTVAASSTAYLGPFDSSKYSQLDGSINLDFQSGISGTITALIQPKRW